MYSRVTTLGEFSPVWVKVYRVHFFENHKSIISGLLFSRLWLSFNFDKNELGYILGNFFSKTHPVTLMYSYNAVVG
jgi:hypothetical protein